MTDLFDDAGRLIDEVTGEVLSEPGPPPALIPDGVFLNMPEAVYHADPALGSTDLKAILTNPVQWHARNRNPDRDLYYPPAPEDSASKRFGRALHKIVLEGAEAFDAAYMVAPDAPEGLIDTNEELYAYVAERAGPPVVGEPRWFTGLPDTTVNGLIAARTGLPKKGAKKEHLIAAARHLGCSTLRMDWEAAVKAEAGDRELISAEWWRKLHTIRRVLDRHEFAPKLVTKGRPEVSVFWTDESGTRLKCRFDYLKARSLVDLKSYAIREGREIIETFVSAIETFAYDLSRAHYMDGRVNVLPRLVGQGKVYDANPWMKADDEGPDAHAPSAADVAFLQKVAAETEPTWFWLACCTMGFPEVDVIELPAQLMVNVAAETQLAEAKAKYADFRERFGPDDAVPWVADRGVVVLTEASFSMRIVNRASPRWERRDD